MRSWLVRSLGSVGILGLSLSWIGCSNPTPQAPSKADATQDASSKDAPSKGAAVAEKADAKPAGSPATTESPTDAAIKVGPANHAELVAKVKSFKGRVVVVDVWSTSCIPCMKEFPHLVELARRWPEDVVCLSMNVDYIGLPNKPVDSYTPKIAEFLTSVSASLPNLENLVGSEPDSDMLTKLDIESMPGILVYDRTGELSSKLTTNNAGADGLTYAGDVVPLVEKLVEKR